MSDLKKSEYDTSSEMSVSEVSEVISDLTDKFKLIYIPIDYWRRGKYAKR